MDSEATDSTEQASKEIAKKLTVSVTTVVPACSSTLFQVFVCVRRSSYPLIFFPNQKSRDWYARLTYGIS